MSQNSLEKSFFQKISDVAVGTIVVGAILYTIFSFAYPYIQGSRLESARQQGYTEGYNAATNVALQSFSGNIFQNGYVSAFGEIGQALVEQYKGGCQQPVPLRLGGTGSVGIVSIDCLALAQSGATSTPGANSPQRNPQPQQGSQPNQAPAPSGNTPGAPTPTPPRR